MLKYLLILFFIVSYARLFAQFDETGFPLIQNIPPKAYGYESQNFAITQNNQGIFFISNVSGILQYDGIHWNLIPAQGIPRLCSDKKGNVYAGLYKDFGIVTQGEKNKYEFHSLVPSQRLKEKIGDVSSLISYRNEILFIGNYSYLYSYNGRNINVIDSTSNLLELYTINDKLFVFKEPGGLYQYANGNMILWLSSQSLNNKIIEFFIPYYDKFLIKFRNEKSIFILNKTGEIVPFSNEIEDYLDEHQYSCFIMTPDSVYVFGTHRGGIIGMNTKGRALFELSTDNLLLNDNINDLFIDKWNNVWVSLNNGLSRIEIYSAFSYFSTVNGVKGGVSNICRFNNKVYIATTQGLRYLDKTSFQKQTVHGNMFKLVKEIQVDCNKLLATPSGLLVSTDNGLYFIDKNDKVQVVNKEHIFEDFLAIDSTYKQIVICLNNGLGIIEFKNNKPIFRQLKTDFFDHTRTIAKDAQGSYWLGSDYNGVYNVSIDLEKYSVKTIGHYKTGKGFPANIGWVDVYSTQRGVLFSTQSGPFLFDYANKSFVADTFLIPDLKTWIFPLKEDHYHNIWYSSGKEGIYEKETGVAFYLKKNQYKIVKNPFKVIREFTIESIFPDLNAVTWFGTFDGLIRFDAKKLTQDTSKLSLFLSSFIAGNDTIVASSTWSNNDEQVFINYKNHNIRFDFIAPYFDAKNNIQYQYYLEGFDKNWSDWTTNTFKEYTNLFEGNYVFHVRAKNIYGTISNEMVYHFKILAPVYRQWYAYLIYIILLASLVLMIFQWRAYSFAQEKHHIETLLNIRTKQLAEEKEKVDELIRNILPEETVQSLKENGFVEKKKYSLVSVLFADVQGFTHITEQMSPEMLIDELNLVFKNFDDICDQYGVEKIKTIGDAYMCAGGVPKKNRTNPIDVTLAALKMQHFIKNNKEIFKYQWSIRVGIHSGTVVAGVVGSKKFSYDIWGDAVNIASRMESSSVAGEINVSGDVYGRIKDYFECEYRGKLPVKHKGEIDMYFVKGIKKEMAMPENPNEPNDKFRLKLQFLKYDDLEEFVLLKLEKSLPNNLYYHDLKHTIDVITQVEMLALGEKVSREELLLLKTAALLHDTGFMKGYDDHEELGVRFAREILPQYGYRQDQIDIICRLILATKFPPDPQDHLEQIICDADLDYLGRSDFIPVSQNLFRELFERGKIRSVDAWNKMQYEFIRKHQYFTETAKRKRNINKTNQLDELDKLV